MFEQLKQSFSSTPENPSVDDMLRTYNAADFQQHGMEVIRTPAHQDVRVLFYEQYCEFCFKWLEVIDKFNLKLDRQAQRIEKVDIEGTKPIVQEVDPQGAPTLIIDGILVRGITSEGFGRGFLQGFLEEEMVMK